MTLALAKLNFDFSLVKMEAPAEYQGLGHSLSKRHKIDAEGGSTHITVGKLGALFEVRWHDAQYLYEAYS